MMATRKTWSVLFVLFVLTGAAWTGVHLMEARAASTALSAHQAQWDCWRKRTAENPECVRVLRLGAEDADACIAAVAACRADGTEAAADKAANKLQLWVALSALLMLAMLAEAIAFLGRGTFVLLSRRRGL